MTLFDITKSIAVEIIAIFDIILREIFEIAAKVREAERVVLEVIKVVIASKIIAKIVTNFLKTLLIYSS